MKTIKNILTHKRMKSFYWRTGMMILSGLLAAIAEVIADIGLSGTTVVIVGLILGEISKSVNKYATEQGLKMNP